MSADDNVPRWVSELQRLSRTRKQILLYGNVRDEVYLPPPDSAEAEEWASYPLDKALMRILVEYVGGYEVVGHYDVVDGMVYADELPDLSFQSGHDGQAAPQRPMAELFAESVNGAGDSWRQGRGRPAPHSHPDALNTAFREIRSALRCADRTKQHSTAIVIDYGTQLIASAGNLSDAERHAFLQLLKSSQESPLIGKGPQKRQNLLIVVCDELIDLPLWTYMDNPFTGSIAVTTPTRKERLAFFTKEAPEMDPEEAADLTDGMSVRDLNEIVRLAPDHVAPDAKGRNGESDPAAKAARLTLPKTVVDHYKFGDRASLWSDIGWGDLANAEEVLGESVFGQRAAIDHVSDVLRRARLHLSGAQHGGRGTPRGVLFFAGPTGVGKTELAKAVTRLLFGDEEHYARFDMSEYAQENSDQRLIGAPPGYVGYDAGGQLTNRVREEPFSVLLFDEIDKAHPTILEKFLQILEDGRMTDGRGRTVFFSECLLIFTSNAGMYEKDGQGGERLRFDDPERTTYGQVRETLLEGIREFFVQELQRPELLNRFGENIVVFDFVREPFLTKVLKKATASVCSRVQERWGIEAEVTDEAIERLRELSNLRAAEGGRGVNNKIEVRLLNPLSRWLFDNIPSRLEGAPTDRAAVAASVGATLTDDPFRVPPGQDPFMGAPLQDVGKPMQDESHHDPLPFAMSDREMRAGLEGARIRITDVWAEGPEHVEGAEGPEAEQSAQATKYHISATWV